MIRPVTLTLFFTFFAFCCSAQSWKWAVETPDPSEVIDIAAGTRGESIVLTKGLENEYHLDVYDSSGIRVREKTMLFRDYSSSELYALETDDTGNIYLVSRQVLDIAPPVIVMREWWDQRDGHGLYEDEIPGEPDFHTFIVLEKYSPELELITQMKLLRADAMDEGSYPEYSVSVRDFYVDGKGACWVAGKKQMNARVCWREDVEITDAGKGCHFLMKIGSALKQPEWVIAFAGGDAGDINTMHIAVNNVGICMMSGCFYDSIKFGDKLLRAHDVPVNARSGENEMYLTAVSSEGKLLWAQSTGVHSYDEDVVALSGGGFVASGRCMNADHIGETKLAKEQPVAMFLIEIDPNTGKHGKLYFNDTSAINNLEAGRNNDFYCDFQLKNSSDLLFIYHFDSKLKPKLVSRYLGHDSVTCSRNGVIFYSASWSGCAAFGFRPYEAYLPGDLSYSAGFLAKFTIK